MLKHISEFFKLKPKPTCEHSWEVSAAGRSWDHTGALQYAYTCFQCSKCKSSYTKDGEWHD